jgi:stage V sporulation protein AE
METVLQLIRAFIVGGMFCVIAQILIDKTALTPAKILVSFVVFGVFLGAVGIYGPLFEYFGCGASIPLIGFGGSIAKGVKKAVIEMGLLGALGGPFTAAGAGISASIISAFIFSIFFSPKSKKL